MAGFYEAYLSAALDVKAVVAVLTWGLTDRYTWLARRHPRPSGAPIRPLPLDREYQRKPAWRAIAKAMAGRPALSATSDTRRRTGKRMVEMGGSGCGV
ncbi:MAG: endo-1,4-beta-xylanase [Bryobacterales bacterium]|nr:endo-1,4-beta-xylanase [Bryobacterales bacterium]